MPDSAADLDPAAFFVYGTLKRGECRERCWPRTAIEVLAATVFAELYDLGPYPALRAGGDLVAGEVRRLRPEDMAETLRILDGIEGFRGLPSELYIRRVILCRTSDGREIRAWSYFYSRAKACTSERRVPPDADGRCRWNG